MTFWQICILLAVFWFVYRKLSWSLGKVDFSGKVVLIAGASSGIGEELAK
jgi:hypothetical protein